MRGLIINNQNRNSCDRPRRLDRVHRPLQPVHGDSEAPYWHGAATNSGLLAAAAWQAEQVALAHYPSKKQRDEGEREGRCDLSISTAEQSVHLHVSQRWPRIARLTWPLPCRKPPLSPARSPTPASSRPARCSSAPEGRAARQSRGAARLGRRPAKHTACAIAWHFPTPTVRCTTNWGSISLGWHCCSSRRRQADEPTRKPSGGR